MTEGITVKANIRLLPTGEGGRASSIKGNYRPNHNFFGPDDLDMTMGFIDLPITFWNWPGLEGQIYQGREWRIQEGAKLVGIGIVLDLLPPDNEFTT